MNKRMAVLVRNIGTKRVGAIAVALALLLTCLPFGIFSSAYSEELIADGGFDTGLTEWYVSGKVTAEDDCAVLSGADGQSLLQSAEAEAAAESDYTLSFDIRLPAGAVLLPQVVQYGAESGSAAGNVTVPLEDAAKTGEWTTVTYTFRTAADVTGLSVLFDVTAGTVAVDNVSLKRTHDAPAYEVEGEPVAVQNAGFADRLTDWTSSGAVGVTAGWFGKAAALYPETLSASLSQSIVLEANASYELHYYIKAVDATGVNSALEIDMDGDGSTDSLVPYTLEGNSAAEGWQEVTVQFDTSTAGTATLRLMASGGGAAAMVAFDEITLTKLPGGLSFYALTDNNLYQGSGLWSYQSANFSMGTAEDDTYGTVNTATVIAAVAPGSAEINFDFNATESDKTYVLSFYGKATCGDVQILPFLYNTSGIPQQLADVTIGNEWTYCRIEFTGADLYRAQLRTLTALAVDDVVSFAEISVAEKKSETEPDPEPEPEPTVENLYQNTGLWSYRSANFSMGTAEDDAYGTVNTATVIAAVASGGAEINFDFKATESGKTYILSFYAKASCGNVQLLPFLYNTSGIPQQMTDVTVGNEWTYCRVEFTGADIYRAQLRTLTALAVDDVISFAEITVGEKPETAAWITNGNMTVEDGTKHWTGFSAADVIDGTTAGAESGNAFRVTGAATVTYRAFTKPVTAGAKYTLRFRMRNDAVVNEGLGSVYFTKADGSGELAKTALTATNGVWKEYRVDFIAEEGYEKPWLHLALADGVTYTFADFSFDKYEEYLSNGDFANGTDDWTLLVMPGSNPTLETVEDAEYGHVLHVSKPKSDTYMSDIFHVKLTKTLTVGKTYTFTYYYKSDAVSDTGASSYPYIQAGNVPTIPVSVCTDLDNGWQEVTFDLTVTAGWESVQLVLRMMSLTEPEETGAVNYWFANASIVEKTDAPKPQVGFTNGDFSLTVGTYPKFWGAVGEDVAVTDGTVTVTPSAGVSGLSVAYGDVEHKVTFRIKADATARENFLLRATYYQTENRDRVETSEYYTLLEPAFADTDDWQSVSVVFVAPQGTQYADLMFLSAQGDYLLDDVSIELSGDARLNLGFEYGEGTPLAWSYNGTGKFSRVQEGYDGGYAAKATDAAGAELTSASFEMKPGLDYVISYWIKTDMPFDSMVHSTLYMQDENGDIATVTAYVGDAAVNYRQQLGLAAFPWTSRTYGSTVTAENPEGWQHVRMTVRSSDTAATGYLVLALSGKATLWMVDDVKVYAEAEPATADEANERALAQLDFEMADANDSTYPEGWYLSSTREAAPVFERDTEFYHSGMASAHLKLNSLNDACYLISTNLLPVNEGGDTRIYEASFWLSSRGADIKDMSMGLWYYDENGIKLYTAGVGSLDFHADGTRTTLGGSDQMSEWNEIVTRISVPNTVQGQRVAYAALVFTFTPGKGELWIDDLFFDQVEDDSTIIVEQNNFHAVDSDGNLGGWTASEGATLSQDTDGEEGAYGHLTVNSGSGYMVHRNTKTASDYQYAYVVRYRSEQAVDMQLRYSNYQEQEYTAKRQTYTLPATGGKWAEEEIRFSAVSATYVDLYLGLAAAGELDVSRIILYLVDRPATSLSWEGEWIGYAATSLSAVEYDISYYRHMVYLEDEVTVAPFQITADDKYEFFVNGERIFSNMDGGLDIWSNITYLDLQPYLHKGENMVAIAVYNHGAYSALIYDGRWTMANGKTVTVYSTPDTLVINPDGLMVEPEGNWKDVDYDDSAWGCCISYGVPPASPWGSLYFDSSLYIDNTLELVGVEGNNDLVRDLSFEFSVTMKMEEAITASVPLSVTLWEKNSVNEICDLSVSMLNYNSITEWPVGEEFTVEMQVKLPDYLADGSYTLQLDTTYFLFANEDVYDNKFINFCNLNDYEATELETAVEVINGVPTYVVNGELKSSFWFQANAQNSSAGLGDISNSDIETIAGCTVSFAGSGNDAGWQTTGVLNFDEFDKNINNILSASTDAQIIVGISCNAPNWWLEENPDEAVVSYDSAGNKTVHPNASFGSEKWMLQCGELIKELIAHMKEQDYYSRVAGFRLSGGRTAEFMTIGADSARSDYAPVVEAYFQNWAKETYSTIEAVREAWNEPDLASFENITLPSYKKVYGADTDTWGELIDPATDQKVLDFGYILDEMTADNLTYWAQCTKEACDNKLIVGAYYGYLWLSPSVGTQHTAFERVVSSEYLDFFCAPLSYNERRFGESEAVEAVVDSMQAYGKLVIGEQDNRTVLTGQFAGTIWDPDDDFQIGRTHTMNETLLQFKRDLAFNMASGIGQWYYDMYGNWFADEQIYEFSRDANAEHDFYNHIEKDVINDVAVIVPDDNAGRFSAGLNYTIIALNLYAVNRQRLSDMGVSYDVYTQETFNAGLMPEHKVNIFLSPLLLTEEDRTAIDKYAKNNDQINIFLYKSGLGDEDGYALENMTELTGFTFARSTKYSSAQIVITNDQTEVTEGLLGETFGSKTSSAKFIEEEFSVVEDAETVVLGKLRDTDNVGFAMKDMGDWTSIYSYSTELSGDVYRNILKMAGCHIYSDDPGDVVWANSAYVGVHSVSNGNKTITLPGYYAVYDVFEEKIISLNTNVIEYYNESYDTHLFRLTPVDTYSVLAMVKGGHGTVTGNATVTQVAPSSSKTLTITPDEGYMISSVTVNGEEVTVTDNKLTLADINSHNTVVVKFKRVPCTREWTETETGEDVPPADETPEEETPVVNTNPPDEEEPLDNPPASDTGSEYVEQWQRVLDRFFMPWWGFALPAVCLGLLIVLVMLIKRRKKKEEKQ